MKCEECRYWHQPKYQCRRNAPIAVTIGSLQLPSWITTSYDDWCGEFEARPVERNPVIPNAPIETPTEPPEGYRLMTDDETPTESDLEYYFGIWGPSTLIHEGVKSVGWRKVNLGASGYARKISA